MCPTRPGESTCGKSTRLTAQVLQRCIESKRKGVAGEAVDQERLKKTRCLQRGKTKLYPLGMHAWQSLYEETQEAITVEVRRGRVTSGSDWGDLEGLLRVQNSGSRDSCLTGRFYPQGTTHYLPNATDHLPCVLGNRGLI